MSRNPTTRQLDVARLVAAGMTNKEIAHALYVSEQTVKWHLTAMMNRLQMNKRAQIAVWWATQTDTGLGSVIRAEDV